MSFDKEERFDKEQNGRVRIQDVHDDMYGTELDGMDQAGTVSNKYRGTAADRRDMMTLGKQQVLRVRRIELGLATGLYRLLADRRWVEKFPIPLDVGIW